MSVSAIASLRSLSGRCLRHANVGLLSIRIGSPTSAVELCAIVRLKREQLRFASSQDAKDAGSRSLRRAREHPLRRMTFRQFLRTGLRSMAATYNARRIREAWRESPVTMSLSICLLLLVIYVGVDFLRSHFKTFYSPEITKYPEPVAQILRRALWYTIARPDPEKALKYWKRAMELCGEIGLDPFSDEVLGIRIYIFAWLVKINNHKAAIDVLQSLLADCRKWLDVMDQAVRDGRVNEAGRLVADPKSIPSSVASLEPADHEKPSDATKTDETSNASQGTSEQGQEVIPVETLWRKRQRLLAVAVRASIHLGEVYADEHVLDPEKSHEHLLWGVETSLKEMERRRKDGPRLGEEAWLSPEELGSSMESLGRDYERKSQFHLAIPLFFQALRLCDSPCHRAVIMTSLSAAFAQHPMYSPTSSEASAIENLKDLFDSSMPRTRQECLDAGAAWARNAYVHARDVKGDDRTAECDEACAVALCNWGDVARLQGKPELAREKYRKSIEMSKKLKFDEGIKQAQDGLSRLADIPTKASKK
ncbi:hypothetical protein S40293_09568 [Stachybotrys chartarum IBT 40293]|nr:hypothetical protein S40293_09568 [Stachybotrys chartarum IBT 40293]